MTATILRPQLRQALLRQLHNDPKHKRNILQQGFTLVELMIVIVIVGILSAVALPNFLNQTSKAKATECTTKLGAMLSEAGADALLGDTDIVATNMTALADSNTGVSDLCTFESLGFDDATGIYTATAVGTTGSALDGKYFARGCVNPATGKKDVKVSSTTATITVSCAA